ncbi:MAG: GNAT family N-acetyltransferase [Clostridiales bacterium]|nr:GNAT family N-acetyltransferase [Clostridiales bacterium]
MIAFKEVDKSFFPQYDEVTQNVEIHSLYQIKRIDSGLGGLQFEEVPVEPYVKDLAVYERACDYEKLFDNLSTWRFYMAFDGEKPVGAATVAGTTEHLDMLAGRKDLCVLWDIRVQDGYKHQGIGQKLFDMAVAGGKKDGYKQMVIECQNTNVTAVNFYKKQGALLGKVDMYAYYAETGLEDEAQLLWYLDL